MDCNKFIENVSVRFPASVFMRAENSSGKAANILSTIVILYLDNREFWIRFSFRKTHTDCEVSIEEEHENKPFDWVAIYNIETPVEDIKTVDISSDHTIRDIFLKINDAYVNS